MEKTITLAVVPGKGFRQVNIDTAMTVQDFAQKFDLTNRDISLDGSLVEKSTWADRRLGDVGEIYATRASKGA